MHRIISKIIALLPEMTRAQERIANELIRNPSAAEKLTLSQIAAGTGSSEATFIRFCRKLGYDGFTSFQEDFSLANRENSGQFYSIEPAEDMNSILEKLYRSNLEVLSETVAIRTNDYEKAMDALLKAESIHFFAVGDACMTARLCCLKFMRIGVTCTAAEDVMRQMVLASNLTERDVAVAVSYEGRSRNVVDAMRIARERGATTVSITCRNRSPLMDYTDIRLLIPGRDLTIGRDVITRRAADQLILEALYVGYESRMDQSVRERIRLTNQAIDLNKI